MIKRGDRPKSPSDISNCVGAERRRNVRGGTNGPMGPRRWEKKSLPPLNWMCATTLRSAVVRLAGLAVAGRLVAGCPISLGRRTNERTGGGKGFYEVLPPSHPPVLLPLLQLLLGGVSRCCTVHTLSSLPIPCAGGGEAWRGITPLSWPPMFVQVREKRKRAERVKCFSNFGQCFRDVNLRNRYL